ncbi:MAG TPA: glycosyltransferase family 2 protein [Rhodanobacter sp.]|jgi:N-acetylglucosaminyl-diphospho-decaprenol L-rhamnosyltransferase
MPVSPFNPVVPQLSVIVVAADSGASLRDCVRAVLAWSVPLELLLIDNGSSDGVPQALDRALSADPRLRLIYNYANLGFGPAVNRAAAQARSDRLLILNPDCVLEQAGVQRLLDILASEPHAGLLGAVVCGADGVPDPASLRRDPLLHRTLNSLRGKATDGVNVAGPLPDHVVAAEAVSGALMFLPRAVFERMNGFDETYFLHFEDLDLCRRVRDAGYRVLLAGDVRVLHGKGGSSAHRPVFVSRHKHRGMWRWFRKFDPAARRPWLAGLVWVGIWLHFLWQIPGQVWRLYLRKGARSGGERNDV